MLCIAPTAIISRRLDNACVLSANFHCCVNCGFQLFSIVWQIVFANLFTWTN